MNRYASRSRTSSKWESRLGRTDSPIETEFLDQFCAHAQTNGYSLANRSARREGVIVVKPQCPVGPYFADFLISYHFFGGDISIVVECDGHEYHERTKAQAARDRKRDRFMQQAGHLVFRFTGSELRGAPSKCAYEVLDAIVSFQTAQVVSAYERAQERQAA